MPRPQTLTNIQALKAPYVAAPSSTQEITNYFRFQPDIPGGAGGSVSFDDTNGTQRYPRSFDGGFIMHPTGGVTVSPPLPPDFSPSSQVGSLEVVPQRPYVCGTAQKGWNRKPPILFTCGRPGVKLLDAANEQPNGMDGRDNCPFDTNTQGLTIRIHVGH